MLDPGTCIGSRRRSSCPLEPGEHMGDRFIALCMDADAPPLRPGPLNQGNEVIGLVEVQRVLALNPGVGP